MPIKMLDISDYNADINEEQQARLDDADVIAVKATEGTGYTSPSFPRQWKRAKELGKARIAYHFNHPSLSAVAQNRFFVDTVTNEGLDAEDCLALDHETTDGLAPDDVSKQAQTFRDAIQDETKCKLIIYTYINFALLGNCAGLGDNPLWIADPSHPPANPQIPAPWKDWLIHQYGINGRGVDLDLCHFDKVDDLYQYAVLPKSPEPGPDMREVYISDGTAEHSTFVHESALVGGFRVSVGDAVFKILR